MIQQRNKPVIAYKEPCVQENGLNKFRTIVFKVPVSKKLIDLKMRFFNSEYLVFFF